MPMDALHPIERFILEHVEDSPEGIVRLAAGQFGVSRQAVHRYIGSLLDAGVLVAQGRTRDRRYELAFRVLGEFSIPLPTGPAEDIVWREAIAPHVADLPANVQSIWHYGFTEMFNNAIDHSGGTGVFVGLGQEGLKKCLLLRDDGEGIFRKIKRELALPDERSAMSELAKGKLTTDPDRHTGEGIFFTSRAFDEFSIASAGLYFSHEEERPRDLLWDLAAEESGTTVWMDQRDESSRTLKEVFDAYTTQDGEFEFSKTMVSLKLVRHEGETLVSRSQAKRLVTRFEQFREVVLDFSGIASVGQGFADEVFRVFAIEHPATRLIPVNMNEEVTRMVSRAQKAAILASGEPSG